VDAGQFPDLYEGAEVCCVGVFLSTAPDYLREFAEVALLGFFPAGLINAVVNKQVVARRLGGNVVGANALAAVWGFVTLLCCCAGIPTALTLYRSGSRRGPACAFLIAVPWFNWYGLTALVIFLGWRVGLIVSLSAVTVGFVTGIVIDTIVGRPPQVSETPVLPAAAIAQGVAIPSLRFPPAGLCSVSPIPEKRCGPGYGSQSTCCVSLACG
jgi:uncharacterized membrane protein YraQ (UPF0718 family)